MKNLNQRPWLRALPLVACAAAALIAGCSDTPKAPVQAREDAYLPDQVQLVDEGLRGRTAFGAPIVSRDPSGGLAFVTVPVRAATNRPLDIEYRATFFDPNGQPLPGSPTTWFPRRLAPNVFDRITVNSTSPRAADFQIDFRYAK